MGVFAQGLLTGLFLQLAIGPVFLFIANLTLQKTVYDGFAGVLAVTLADYVYIALAIMGVGKILEKKKIQKVFGVVSAIVLILFGIMLMKTMGGGSVVTSLDHSADLVSSFVSVFLLTISSPLTIVMWASVFAAKALEKNYAKRELMIFGVSAGLATFLFMGTSVIVLSLVQAVISPLLIQILNVIVGGLIVLYGGLRLATVLWGK